MNLQVSHVPRRTRCDEGLGLKVRPPGSADRPSEELRSPSLRAQGQRGTRAALPLLFLWGSWDRGRHVELTPRLFLKSPPPTAWANLESSMLSESRQTQKDKLFMIPLLGDA